MKPGTVKRWLRTSISRRAPGGIDQYGQPAWGAATTIKARVVHQARRTRSIDGEEITSTTQVQTLAAVSVGDQLTVDGVTRIVLGVQRADGILGGATITEALL